MRKILILIFIFLVSTGSSFSIEEEIRLADSIEFEINPYEAKKVLFKNSVVDEFSPVLNFRGVYEADISDEKDSFKYPFVLEGGGEVKFGESKNKIRVVSNFTRNVDGFHHKFLGKLSDVYFEKNINENHKFLIGNARVPFGFEGSKST